MFVYECFNTLRYILFMKHIVLFIILTLALVNNSLGQATKIKEILEKSRYAHTGGVRLSTYRLETIFHKLERTHAEPSENGQVMAMLESLIRALPDIDTTELQNEFRAAEENYLEEMSSMYQEIKDVEYSDVEINKFAEIKITNNTLRGTLDSTKRIDESNGTGILTMNNPIEVINVMMTGRYPLHYVGEVTLNGRTNYQVQMQQGNKWLDMYIDQSTFLLSRMSIPQVDPDPLMGSGPLNYKMIWDYRDYKAFNSFILPLKIDEIFTLTPHRKVISANWSYINDSLPEGIFETQVPRTYKIKTVSIGNGLWVMDQSGELMNDRLLIRQGKSNQIDIMTYISNNKEYNEKLLEALDLQFPGYQIRGLFNIQNPGGVISLAGFFEKKAHLYAPKEKGLFSDDYSFLIQGEDSTWEVLRSQNLITSFDKEFQTEGVTALILNPVLARGVSSYVVAYYFTEEKVIYLNGNPYSADSSSKNANSWEKKLYERIKGSKLSVDKIVYTKAWMDNAPLFMSIEAFEQRILNSDFSTLKSWEK
jgi:hypothetical protein